MGADTGGTWAPYEPRGPWAFIVLPATADCCEAAREKIQARWARQVGARRN